MSRFRQEDPRLLAARFWVIGWLRLGVQGRHHLAGRGRRFAKSPKANKRARVAEENMRKVRKELRIATERRTKD